MASPVINGDHKQPMGAAGAQFPRICFTHICLDSSQLYTAQMPHAGTDELYTRLSRGDRKKWECIRLLPIHMCASSPEGLSIFKEQIVFTFKAQPQSHPAGLGRGRHQNEASQQKLNNP